MRCARRLRAHVEALQPGHGSPIVPIILGEEAHAVEADRALLERGLLVPAIRPPTVAAGSSRLRVTMSAAHTTAQVEMLLGALHELGLLDALARVLSGSCSCSARGPGWARRG